MSRGRLLVGAGGCERGRACAGVPARIPRPPCLLRPSPAHQVDTTLTTHCTASGSRARGAEGGAITDFVAAAVPGGGAAVDRMYGITRPQASTPPARCTVPGAAQPLHRR